MQKVYLLLRNNQQSGPYSLDELVTLGLKDDDLIWVEGRSSCWSFPSEIEPLQPFVKSMEKAPTNGFEKVTEQERHQSFMPPIDKKSLPRNGAANKVFVSLPGDTNKSLASFVSKPSSAQNVEQKAAYLRERALAYAAGKEVSEKEPIMEIKYARTLNDVEEEFTSWAYKKAQRKRHSISGKNMAAAAVAILLLTVIIVAGVNYFKENNTVQRVAESGISKREATSLTIDPAVTSAENIVTETAMENEPETREINNQSKTPAPVNQQTKNSVPANAHNTPASTSEFEIATGDPAPVNTIPDAVNEDPVSNSEATSSSKEKKKTLGQKIDGIFDKLKKDKEAPADDQQKTSTVEGTGERRSQRRGEETAPTNTSEKVSKEDGIDLSRYVSVTSNEATLNKWMMGVKGLKITLNNRSSETLKNAAVEVSYYTEQDELLEKKTMNFTNVPPYKRVTLSAPDHRLADHTDYKLLHISN